jgi:hypothetical protein
MKKKVENKEVDIDEQNRLEEQKQKKEEEIKRKREDYEEVSKRSKDQKLRAQEGKIQITISRKEINK